jgi:hypothetical protein
LPPDKIIAGETIAFCPPAMIKCYFRNIETIQIISPITKITDIIPTTAPALKIPAIASQLLRLSNIKNTNGACNFFMAERNNKFIIC